MPIDINRLRDGRKFSYSRNEMNRVIRETDFNLYPVRKWGEFTYAVTGKIQLRAGAQRLPVYDLTGIDFAIFVHPDSIVGEYESLEELLTDYPNANIQVLIYEGEGHAMQLCESGRVGEWLRDADLPIEVVPASAASRLQIREQQMDELEASIDVGGSII